MTSTIDLQLLTAVPALAGRPESITRTDALATPWSRHRFGWRRRSEKAASAAAIVAAGLDGRTTATQPMTLATPWDGVALPNTPALGVTALPTL